MEDRVDILKEHFEITGRRPVDMSQDEIKSLVGHLNDWREWVVVQGFRSVLAFIVIAGFLIHDANG